MLRNLGILATLTLALSLFSLPACDTASCEDVVCGFNQFCASGNCFCIDGYEGSGCQQEAYQKYANKNWFVSETCADGSAKSYQSFIRYTGDALNKVWIDNFAGLGLSVPAYIYTNTANQGNVIEVDWDQGLIQDIIGRGNYINFDNSISMDVTYTLSGQFKQCVLTFR